MGLTFNSIKSQSFFSGKNLSVTANYGTGKIVYFDDYTPRYIDGADQEAVDYSPSWSFSLQETFWLNDRFDFYFGLSHITITEKTHFTAKPSWFPYSEENLSQGFIHLTPGFKMKLPDDKFTINLGARMGFPNLIGNTKAEFQFDFCLESGASIRFANKLFFKPELIYGITKYDYGTSAPVFGVSYFKYHAFQLGIEYVLHANKVP
jgi:hypothetical protein